MFCHDPIPAIASITGANWQTEQIENRTCRCVHVFRFLQLHFSLWRMHGHRYKFNRVCTSKGLFLRRLFFLFLQFSVFFYSFCFYVSAGYTRSIVAKTIMFSQCPIVCPVVPWQHGLVRKAGESITHMLLWIHQMAASGLQLSSYTAAVSLSVKQTSGQLVRSDPNVVTTLCRI